MKLLAKNIKSIDRFGKQITLNFKGRPGSLSFFGGLCTLLNSIVFWSLCFSYFYKFLFDNAPIISYESQTRESNEFYVIKPDDVKFFLGLFTYGNGEAPPKPKLVKPINATLNLTEKSTHKKITKTGEIGDCKNYEDDLKFSSIRKNLSLRNLTTCTYLNKTDMPKIGGDILVNQNQSLLSIEINFNLCDILDRKSDCDVTNVTNKDFSNFINLFFYKKSYMDKNLPEGYSYSYKYLKMEFVHDLDTKITLKAKKTFISTDVNWIFNFIPNEEQEIFVMDADYTLTSKKNVTEENKRFKKFTIEVELDENKINIERKYTKIDDIMANVGAIVSLFEFISIYIAEYFTEGDLEHSIYKEIFFIKNRNDKDKDKDKVKEKSNNNNDNDNDNKLRKFNFNFLDFEFKLKKQNERKKEENNERNNERIIKNFDGNLNLKKNIDIEIEMELELKQKNKIFEKGKYN